MKGANIVEYCQVAQSGCTKKRGLLLLALQRFCRHLVRLKEHRRNIETMAKYKERGHAIYHGDALEILQSEILDKSIDLVFVDPPYNIGKKFSNFYDKWPSN